MDLSKKELIAKNLRFAAYQGLLKDEKVFIKTALQEDLHQSIWKEAAGLTIMYELDPEARFYRVPKVLYISGDTLITSWAEGHPALEYFESKNLEAVSKHINFLLELYAYLDSKTTSSVGVTRVNQPGKQNGIEKALERIGEIGQKNPIDMKLFREVGAYAKGLETIVENRFTHGDLQAGNVLVNGNDVPTIVDCEGCSFLWPRHYNIVNLVFNYTLNHGEWLGEDLEAAFWKYFEVVGIDPKDAAYQINFSASLRCLQSISEQLMGHSTEGLDALPKHIEDFIVKAMKNIVEGKLFLE